MKITAFSQRLSTIAASIKYLREYRISLYHDYSGVSFEKKLCHVKSERLNGPHIINEYNYTANNCILNSLLGVVIYYYHLQYFLEHFVSTVHTLLFTFLMYGILSLKK